MSDYLADFDDEPDKRLQSHSNQSDRNQKPQLHTSSQKKVQDVIKQDLVFQNKLQKKTIAVTLPSIINHSPKLKSTLTPQQDKQRSDLLRKLTNENKKLIQQLKFLNDKLTDVINRQVKKPLLKINKQLPIQPTQTSKQLQQAYKQLNSLKSFITKQKSKQISIEQRSRINDLQNQIRNSEFQSRSISKQIKAIDQIKGTQQKQIKKNQIEGPKSRILYLTKQINEQKQNLKNLRKDVMRFEEVDRVQHEYARCLEKMYKDLNENNKQKEEEEGKEISEEQWEELKNQIARAKQQNKEYGKKVEHMKRQKVKSMNEWNMVDNKFKEKSKQLMLVEKKYHDTKLLILTAKPTRTQSKSKQYGERVSNKQKAYDRNSLEQENILTVGERLKGSTNVSDQSSLQHQNTRMTKLNLWISENNELSGISAFYSNNKQQQQIQGDQIGSCHGQPSKQLDLSQDNIHKMSGCFNKKGFITSLLITLLSGQQHQIGKQGSNTFQIQKKGSHICCLQGSFILNHEGSSICQLGFSFKTN